MSPDDVRRAFRDPEDIHVPRSRLLCLENAHSLGTVLPLSYMREMSVLTHELGMAVHLDGARLFNAKAVLKCDPAELAQCADSVMFCLSKGLCAPVGSMLCGSKAFIAKARKYRKLLGGGMRQAGILAAAGLVAISPEMRGRLEADHVNAQHLYSGLSGLFSNMQAPDINMVYFSLADSGISPDSLISAFAAADILFNPPSASGEVRLVTHHGVSAADVDRVIEVIRSAAR
jgi:threonine aldolase